MRQVTQHVPYAKVAVPLKTVFTERTTSQSFWAEVADVLIEGPTGEIIKLIVQRRNDQKLPYCMVADSHGFQFLVEFRGFQAALPEELWANFVRSGFVKAALTWRRASFI